MTLTKKHGICFTHEAIDGKIYEVIASVSGNCEETVIEFAEAYFGDEDNPTKLTSFERDNIETKVIDRFIEWYLSSD